jgi:spore maturation protein SpmA
MHTALLVLLVVGLASITLIPFVIRVAVGREFATSPMAVFIATIPGLLAAPLLGMLFT